MSSTKKNFNNPKRPEREGHIVTVGRVEDVPPNRGATVELADGTELALFNIDGEFYAIENFCPHRGAPIADGRLCGPVVECDWHGWLFDVRNGSCITRPNSSIESYPVIIEDGLIKIEL
jgi:nitrite reductase/ring-hydroxylating ferredoxin subunit